MKQKIHVSQEDIDTTEQGHPQACMVWKAVTRNLQLESETGSAPVTVSVDYRRITFMGKNGTVQMNLSPQTQARIRHFDQDRTLVEPFDFNLNLPDDWREQVTGPMRNGE